MLIIVSIILFLLYEIQQLISNIDSWMECMTFHVQLLNCYAMFWDGGYVAWSQHRPKSRLAKNLPTHQTMWVHATCKLVLDKII